MHGGHQLYHIPTGKLITRHGKLHVIPTSLHIINKINALGKKQNGSILKIESKYSPTWSAAVDDDQNKDQDQEQPDTYVSKESQSDSDSNDDDDDTLDTEESTIPEESDSLEDEPQDKNMDEGDTTTSDPEQEVHTETITELSWCQNQKHLMCLSKHKNKNNQDRTKMCCKNQQMISKTP